EPDGDDLLVLQLVIGRVARDGLAVHLEDDLTRFPLARLARRVRAAVAVLPGGLGGIGARALPRGDLALGDRPSAVLHEQAERRVAAGFRAVVRVDVDEPVAVRVDAGAHSGVVRLVLERGRVAEPLTADVHPEGRVPVVLAGLRGAGRRARRAHGEDHT